MSNEYWASDEAFGAYVHNIEFDNNTIDYNHPVHASYVRLVRTF